MDLKRYVSPTLFALMIGCASPEPVAYVYTTEEIEYAPVTYLCNQKEIPTTGKDIILLSEIGPYSNKDFFLSRARLAQKGVNVWMPEGLFPSNPEIQINQQTPSALMQHWVEGWRPLQPEGPEIILADNLSVGFALELGFRLESKEVWLINPPFHALGLEWLYVLTVQDSLTSKTQLQEYGINNYQDLEDFTKLVEENPTAGLHQGGLNYALWNYLLQSDPKDFLTQYKGEIHVLFVPNSKTALSDISKANWKLLAKSQQNLTVELLDENEYNNRLMELFSN